MTYVRTNTGDVRGFEAEPGECLGKGQNVQNVVAEKILISVFFYFFGGRGEHNRLPFLYQGRDRPVSREEYRRFGGSRQNSSTKTLFS